MVQIVEMKGLKISTIYVQQIYGNTADFQLIFLSYGHPVKLWAGKLRTRSFRAYGENIETFKQANRGHWVHRVFTGEQFIDYTTAKPCHQFLHRHGRHGDSLETISGLHSFFVTELYLSLVTPPFSQLQQVNLAYSAAICITLFPIVGAFL